LLVKTPSQARRFFTSKWTISTAVVAIVAGLAIGLVTAFCPPVGLAALAMGLASLYAGAGVAAMGLAIATFATAAAAAVLFIGALLKGAVVGVKAGVKYYQEKSEELDEEQPRQGDAPLGSSTAAMARAGVGGVDAPRVEGAAAAAPLHFQSPAVTAGRQERKQSGSGSGDELDTSSQQPRRV
jgi:hypothetical protein